MHVGDDLFDLRRSFLPSLSPFPAFLGCDTKNTHGSGCNLDLIRHTITQQSVLHDVAATFFSLTNVVAQISILLVKRPINRSSPGLFSSLQTPSLILRPRSQIFFG
jgi:hypothetical protein